MISPEFAPSGYACTACNVASLSDTLGAGCAHWAYKTAEGFQAEFFGALGCGYPKPWPIPEEGPALPDMPPTEGA